MKISMSPDAVFCCPVVVPLALDKRRWFRSIGATKLWGTLGPQIAQLIPGRSLKFLGDQGGCVFTHPLDDRVCRIEHLRERPLACDRG